MNEIQILTKFHKKDGKETITQNFERIDNLVRQNKSIHPVSYSL